MEIAKATAAITIIQRMPIMIIGGRFLVATGSSAVANTGDVVSTGLSASVTTGDVVSTGLAVFTGLLLTAKV